ncbi:MAG: hypothetical protein RLZZ262_2461 [Bacteroidota bacterium]
MSNGLKIGLLVVIAGALGFLGYSQLKQHDTNLGGTMVASTEVSQDEQGKPSATAVKPAGEAGKASQDRAKTTMALDKTIHDFGTINQGDQVECVFKVSNTGKEPLVIESAKGSCGCTVPEYPKEPIAPGQTRDIKVKFNSAGKANNQQKTVTLTANTEPLQTVLTIKSFVNAPEGGNKPKDAVKGGH